MSLSPSGECSVLGSNATCIGRKSASAKSLNSEVSHDLARPEALFLSSGRGVGSEVRPFRGVTPSRRPVLKGGEGHESRDRREGRSSKRLPSRARDHSE